MSTDINVKRYHSLSFAAVEFCEQRKKHAASSMGGVFSRRRSSELQHNRRTSQAATPSDTPNTLGALLENEDILHKVLSYVAADDGLYEVRRVCCRWCEACAKLPVKIRGIRPDEVETVAEMFPEAVSLVPDYLLDSADVVERHLMPHLPRLTKLRHLSLVLPEEEIDIDFLQTSLQSLDRLQSLTLEIVYENALRDALGTLERLTHLVRLDLAVVHDVQTFLEPVTELRGLRELKLDARMLVNVWGQLLFPSLTQLTRLEVRRSSGRDDLDQCPLDLQVSMSPHSRFCLILTPRVCSSPSRLTPRRFDRWRRMCRSDARRRRWRLPGARSASWPASESAAPLRGTTSSLKGFDS